MPSTIRIAPGKVARILLGAVAVLFLAALPAPILRYGLGHDSAHGFVPFAERLFHLSNELTPAAWFSSGALLLCAALLALTGCVRRAAHDRYARHWTVLATIFAYLSLDESAMLHERTITPLRQALGVDGVLHFAWVIPAAVLVLAVGLSYIGFLRALPAPTRMLFVAAGALYVGGALGMELIEGVFATRLGAAYNLSAVRVALTHTEELMEMLGTVLFAYALLAHLRARVGVVEISFAEPTAASTPAAPARTRAARAHAGRGLLAFARRAG